jgi:hypothetical protein
MALRIQFIPSIKVDETNKAPRKYEYLRKSEQIERNLEITLILIYAPVLIPT